MERGNENAVYCPITLLGLGRSVTIPRMKPTRNRLYVATGLMDCSAGTLSFAVMRGLAERGMGLPMLGLIGGLAGVAWAIASLIGGRLADRIDRRQVVIGGATIGFLAALAATLMHGNIAVTVACFWLSSLGAGMFYPAVMTWLNQGSGATPEGRREISRVGIRFCLAWNLGLVTGQLSAGTLFELGMHWPLALTAILHAINLLLVLRIPGERLPPPATISVEAVDLEHQRLSAAFARLSWLANLGSTFVVGIMMNLLPDLMVELGIDPESHGLVLGVLRAVVIATYFLLHHSQFWHYRVSVSIAAHACAVVGLLVLSVTNSGMGLALGMCGIGLLQGFVYFSSFYYSSTGATDHDRGRAFGFHEGTLCFGIAAGSMIGGLAGHVLGSRGPYQVAAVLITALALAQLAVYLRRRPPTIATQ